MDPFNRELKSGLGKAEQQAQTFSQKINAALSPKNLAAGLGVAFGASQVVSFLSDATNAAAEFEDAVSATGVIFGEELIPQMEAWGAAAHENFGASKTDAISAANVIATLGKSAGLAGEDLLGFSQEMVQLGGDLASMFGGTTQDAITAVGAALRGESEPIRRYGVLLDDATLRQRAFEMELISTTKNALTPQQRVLAAHAEILAQTSDAQGDFARTADGMANSQRDLNAQLENVSIEVGQKLLPIMLKFVNFVSDTGIPVMREFIDLLDFGDVNSAEGIAGLEQIEDFLNGASDAALVLNDTINFHKGDIIRAAEEMGVSYMEVRERIREAMQDAGLSHEEAVDKVIADQERLAVVLESGEAWENYQNSITAGAGGVRAAAEDMAGGVVDAMEEAKDEAAEVARQTPGALADQLREGIDDYDKALEDLTEVAVNSVSDLAERQKIEGILASEQLTDALNSDSTRTRLLAQDLVADLVSDYELLAPGALQAGELVNPNLAAGLNSNIALTRYAADQVRDAASNPLVDLGPAAYGWGQTLSANFLAGLSSYYWAIRNASINLGDAAASGIRLRSPAEEGPLSEPADKWGLTLGVMFAKGIRDAIPNVHGASLALAGAAVLRGSVGGMGPLPVGGAIGSTGDGPTFILQVEGQKPIVGTRDDVLDRWQQMTSFAEKGVV